MNNEHTTLTKCRTDLIRLRAICKPGFETNFYNENVRTIIESIDQYLRSEIETAHLLTTTDNLIKKINRFRRVFGTVKIAYKITERAKDAIESQLDPECLITRDLILHIGHSHINAIQRRKPKDEAFFKKAQRVLDNIRQEETIFGKEDIAKRFIRYSETLKTVSYERNITIDLFKKLLENLW